MPCVVYIILQEIVSVTLGNLRDCQKTIKIKGNNKLKQVGILEACERNFIFSNRGGGEVQAMNSVN